MKDFSRHLEYLLCEHNSVAIPGIGIFVTEELQARYYADEKLYLPPLRSVRLDTRNSDDDGKLEHCLIQLHRITRNVARKWISEYIDEINHSLMDMGYMDMGTIGRLVMTSDGKIDFEVCDAGVNTPELYGLDSFHMPKLPAFAHKRQAYKDPTHFTIRLRRTTVHRIMAAAAMLIVAFTIIVPNYGTLNLNGKFQAQMASAESLITLFYNNPHPIAQPIAETTPHFVTGQTEEAHTASTVNTAEEEVPVAQEIPVVEEKTVPAEHQEETTPQPEEADIIQEEVVTHPQNIAPVQEEVISHTEEQASPATIASESTSLEVKGYCVVMASAITHKGAELLIEKLNREGFTNAVKYNDKGMLRVVLTGYPNEAAARAEMAVVRVTDKLYSGSWLKHF